MGTLVAQILLGVIFLFLFGIIGAAIVFTFITTKTGKITALMLTLGLGICLITGIFV